MPEIYDIFLSYAHVDDIDLAEPYAEQTRWVRCFKVALQQAVDRQLGRAGGSQWFFDLKSLRTGDHLSEEITKALDRTRIFVALASYGYFHEDSWCGMEREYFKKKLGSNAGRARRTYAVVLDEDVKSEFGKGGLEEVCYFPFYDKDPATDRCMRHGEGKVSPKFMERISVLASDIAVRIRELRTESMFGPPAPEPARHGTVVLAAVPGEIEDRRTELAAFIEGKGWLVWPKKNECSADVEVCRTDTEAACGKAVTFIQLLSRFPWRPTEFDRIQFEAACKAGMVSCRKEDENERPFFRYRSDDFDLASLSSPEHKAWLQEHDVDARSIPAIKEEIGRFLDNSLLRAERQKHRQPVGINCSAITVSVMSQERPSIGKQLSDRLKRESVYSYLPDQDTPDLGQCFDKEHGFVTVFGNEIYTQRVEKVLMGWRQLWIEAGIRRGYWPPMAVYLSDPPPDNKADAINVVFPGMEIIYSWDNDSFMRFVNAVQRYANQNRASLSGSRS